MKISIKHLLFLLSLNQISGCTLISIADTVASTVIGTVKIGVKGTTAVIGAVIPDGDEEDDD